MLLLSSLLQSSEREIAMDENTVYEDKYFRVINPIPALHCRDDGGHLILIKKETVHDRSDMTWQEAIDFMRISMAVGKAMYEVLDVERMNYADFGNWGLDNPGGAKMHLHFFGRARKQMHQMRGQCMVFFPKDHPIYKGHLKHFNPEEITKLRNEIASILKDEKYTKMAELAGIE
jgi:diadenosine tetraphosphate (Ap4A) HIT family hydrolase